MRPQSLAGHRRVRTCSRLRHRPRHPRPRRRRRRSALSRLVDDVFSHKLGLSAAVASACLSYSLTHSLSLRTHIQVIYSHTHTHTLACSLTHCSSTRQAFVRSFVCRTLTTTTKKFSRTAAARCPFTRLGLDWPRRVLLPGVFVLVLLLCFTSYVLVCVLSPSLCVCMLVLVCRHGALCFVGWTTTTTTERQPQPQQSQRRRARRSTPRSSRVLPPLPLAPHISLNDEAATVAVAVHAARAAVEAATNKQLVSHRTTTNDDALLNTELNFILSLLTIAP